MNNKNYNIPSKLLQTVGIASVAMVFVLAAVMTSLPQTADAVAGSYVQTVTFDKQPNPDAGVDNLIAGNIDIYYQDIRGDNIQKIKDAGHTLYPSAAGTTYHFEINPVDNHTNGFNPFAYQKVRYAVNYMIDRDYFAETVFGSGSAIYSTVPPNHKDYPLVSEYLESLGLVYDLAEADRLIAQALEPAGAVRSTGGEDDRWYYGGEPITIKVIARNDDPVRAEMGRDIVDSLERLGFTVSVTSTDLSGAFDIVYGTDPAAQEWHLYTGAYLYEGHTRTYDYILWQYAPITGALPGGGLDAYWNYEQEQIDKLYVDLINGRHASLEQRAQLVLEGVSLGVAEAVVVSIGVEFSNYAARSDVSGIVNSQLVGIVNRYTPINAQLADSEQDLKVGTRHVSQSSWNPVGGFRDTYSNEIWNLLHDHSFASNPHTREVVDARGMATSIETRGPDGKIAVPPDAIIWNQTDTAWTPSRQTEATSKVTFDIKFANWHNGQPMDINDLLYPIIFEREHHTNDTYLGKPFDLPDPNASLQEAELPLRLVALRVLDADTVEIYINYWSADEQNIAIAASLWPKMPWEIYHAMDMMVHNGTADWYSLEASARSGNWIDALDHNDADMMRMYLEMAREQDSSDHIPIFLYANKTSEYVDGRYNATLAWIADKGHAVISNGPFYLSGPIIRDDSGSITKMTITQFDDPTYPFGPEMWEAFTMFESTAGEVIVGSLAPVSGNAHRYGAEIQAAIDLGISDFNRYVDTRGLGWSFVSRNLDTATSPDKALEQLKELNADGVDIVLGPSIDIITRDMVRYADQNNMLLLSCCSSVPSLAIPDDSLFRMLPDQNVHAQAIVDAITTRGNADTLHVIPVGIDGAWAAELLGATITRFEAQGGTASGTILYTHPLRDEPAESTDRPTLGGDIDDAATQLAMTVEQAVKRHGADNVLVLYVGFGEGPEFLKAALEHDILYDVRWFGADQNTAYPNIADDPASADFARAVGFVAVQPAAHLHVRGSDAHNRVNEHIRGLGLSDSPYSKYAYDSVWVLGHSIINSRSTNTGDIADELSNPQSVFVGASGAVEFNDKGDLKIDDPKHRYVSWTVADADNMWTEYVPPANYYGDGGSRPAMCR